MLKKYKSILPWFFWPTLVCLAILIFADYPNNPDEGVILNAAWQLWHGQAIYLDFVEFIAPLSPYFIFSSWLLFGSASYLVAKIFSIILWLGSALGLSLIIKQFTKNYFAIISTILFWLIINWFHPLINHNSYSSFAAIWLLYLIILTIKYKRPVFYILSGLMAAIVFLFLQTKGLVLGGIMLLIFIALTPGKWPDRFKLSGLAMGSYIFPLLLTFVLLDFNAVFDSLFLLPFKANYLNHTLFSPLAALVAAIIILIMFSCSYFFQKKGLWILSIFQMGLFLSSFNLVDYNHIIINIFPFLIFLAILYNQSGNFSVKHLISISLFWLTTLLILNLVAINLTNKNIFSINLLNAKHDNLLTIPEIDQAKYIYCGPFLPGCYFELKKPNPFTQSSHLLVCSKECHQEALAIFKKIKPEFAILNYRMVERFNYDKDSPIDQYIASNYLYCPDISKNKLVIFARTSCPQSQ